MDIEKIDNNGIKITFHNSTATIGAILQNELLKNPHVIFAGYSKPHPLETKMIVTVITSGKNPKEVFGNAFTGLITRLDELSLTLESLT